MTYDVRPKHMGSWTFLVRERKVSGPLAAEVRFAGLFDEGTILVGAIPFQLDREGFSRAYRLLFEGQALARAEPKGLFTNGYDLSVEAAVLERDVPVGERTSFVWAPTSMGSSSYDLHEGEARLVKLERTGTIFRHFALALDDEIPLAIGAFCLALTLARLRRQSRNG